MDQFAIINPNLFFWTKALAAAIMTKLQTAIAKIEALTAFLEGKAEVDEVFRREIKKRGFSDTVKSQVTVIGEDK